jgi:hypothetical protein
VQQGDIDVLQALTLAVFERALDTAVAIWKESEGAHTAQPHFHHARTPVHLSAPPLAFSLPHSLLAFKSLQYAPYPLSFCTRPECPFALPRSLNYKGLHHRRSVGYRL